MKIHIYDRVIECTADEYPKIAHLLQSKAETQPEGVLKINGDEAQLPPATIEGVPAKAVLSPELLRKYLTRLPFRPLQKKILRHLLDATGPVMSSDLQRACRMSPAEMRGSIGGIVLRGTAMHGWPRHVRGREALFETEWNGKENSYRLRPDFRAALTAHRNVLD
jgi:hypothetical protein